MQFDILKKRRKNSYLIWGIIFIITLATMTIANYNPILGLTSIPKAIFWAGSNFYPTVESLSKLPIIMSKMKETIFLSIAATTTASFFALLLSLLGSKTTNTNKVLSAIARVIASIFRNIPDVVWAMVLLFSFGQNAMAGYLALFFTTFGFLTRAFIETIDESSSECMEAMEATGANPFQTVSQAILPSSAPQLISWILFMIETNIRSATLIGLLTGTGIGFTFSMYYKGMNYNAASLALIFIVVSVIVIEIISNYIRRVIL